MVGLRGMVSSDRQGSQGGQRKNPQRVAGVQYEGLFASGCGSITVPEHMVTHGLSQAALSLEPSMMKPLKNIAALLTAAVLTLPCSAMAGAVWSESGVNGAGDLLPTAQSTYDSSYKSLSGITGVLSATIPIGGSPLYQVDLYKIRVSDPLAFSAKTLDTGFDTALYLFDETGLGVYMNDDDPGSTSGLTSLLSGDTDGDGIFYLAIAFGGYAALDMAGASIFDALGLGVGGPLAAWEPGYPAFEETPWSYSIALTGATNAELPEPGTVGLVLAAGLGLWASRRRHRAASAPSA
jgi:hypothetical protein